MKKEMSGGGGPGLPTFFVFLDLMEHVELQAGSLPLLPEGTEVEFDLQTRSPRDASKTHALSGVYVLERRVLKCGGRHSGMAQYLEWRKK